MSSKSIHRFTYINYIHRHRSEKIIVNMKMKTGHSLAVIVFILTIFFSGLCFWSVLNNVKICIKLRVPLI